MKASDRFKIVAALAFASLISFLQLGYPVGENNPIVFWALGIACGLEAIWQLYKVIKTSN
jgi:hypothetical protein